VNLRDDHGYQVKHDGDRDQIESDFVNFDERRTKSPHGFVGGLVKEFRGAGLEQAGVNTRSRDPFGEDAAKGGPEQIRPGEDETSRHLDQQQEKQQGYADPGEWIVPYVLLRLAGWNDAT
jgi:hypothetical protein